MGTNKKPDHYRKYLTSMHAKLITPDEVIRDVIEEETGLDLVSKNKIVAGEVNEVYEIVLSNKKHAILRISKGGYPGFRQEEWAINKCKGLGVPVPEIIFIKHIEIKGEKKSMCLMEKIDGEPLERGNIEFNKLDLEQRKQFIRQAGEILSKIHSIPTKGFGWIVGAGRAEYKTSNGLIQNLLDKQEHLEEIAREEGIDKTYIKKALRIIQSFREPYSRVVPCLNHGDYSHKHFMVKGDKIVAILDWGGVRSDSPIYDIARWDYWFGDEIPTEWLKEGYTNKSLFDNNFADFFHMLRVFRGLEIIDWYHQEKYKQKVEEAKEKLVKDLKYFS